MTLALVLIAAIAAYTLGHIRGYRNGWRDFQLALMDEGARIDGEVEERLQAQLQAGREGRN